jgi:dTMP kinase
VKGHFITLEGIEGAGKSTLALALRDALHAKGLRVELTREPGGTPLAERLRDLVLTRGEERVSPEAETLIMFASRAVHLDNLVRPALARGTWVICDRFTDATRAYQGGGRGVSTEFIEQLAHTVHAGLEPDLTLLLDLPVEEGLRRAARRRADRGDRTDRFESETVAFFSRVRARYLQIADSAARCQRIDALQPAAVVQAQALAALSRLLEQAE